jgi:hypothetical protein
MPLPIKYTTTNVSSSIRRGNIALGVNAVDYGPSTTTGWTNAVPAPNGGYAIYYLSGTALRMRTAADDNTLITVASQLMGTTYTSVSASLGGLASGGYTAINIIPPNIVTSGSAVSLNSDLIMSYPQSGTAWYDLSGNTNNGTVNNGPVFDSATGAFTFDGTNDFVGFSNQTQFQTPTFTVDGVISPTAGNDGTIVLFTRESARLNLGIAYGGSTGAYFFIRGSNYPTAELNGVQQAYTFTNGLFYYVAFIVDIPGNNYKFYVNGNQVWSSSIALGTNFQSPTNTQGVIASRYGGSSNYSKCRISSFNFYNRVLSTPEIQQNYYQGNIVTSSLAVALDAGNLVSYPGSGSTWYDLSGNGKNFTLVNGVTWNPAGYFTLDGVDDYISGPAGNTFGLGQEHTIEIVINNTLASTTTLFNWRSSQTDRAIMSHAPYSDGVVYYDVGGCCGVTNRISYTPSPSLTNRLTYMIFRCRTSQTPYRQVFENTVEKVNSGANSTANISLSSNIALIGAYNEANLAGSGGVWKGNLYSFRMYNRALTDAEIQQNYNAMKNRYNL